jgi:hypothetical protein
MNHTAQARMIPIPRMEGLSDARSSDEVREAVNTQMENCTHQRGMVYKKMFMGLILFQPALLLAMQSYTYFEK